MDALTTTEDPHAAAWENARLWRQSIYCEMARTDTTDPTAAERRMLDVERSLGLLENVDQLPMPDRVIAEALIADMVVHTVVFCRYSVDPHRFCAAFRLAAAFPERISLFARGDDACLVFRNG